MADRKMDTQAIRKITPKNPTVLAQAAALLILFQKVPGSKGGPDSSVGVPTRYGLDGPVIESRCGGGGQIFRIRPDRPWGPTVNGYRVFPGCKAAGAWR
jgi:hypothetical protein